LDHGSPCINSRENEGQKRRESKKTKEAVIEYMMTAEKRQMIMRATLEVTSVLLLSILFLLYLLLVLQLSCNDLTSRMILLNLDFRE
jgi:hypothetical protein